MATLLEQCLAITLTLALGILPTESQYQQTYKSSVSYRERLQGDTLYSKCNDALVKHAKLSTEPESQTRGSSFGMLASRLPWAPEVSDFDQSLIIDLGSAKNITGIATQGRAASKQFVREYTVQFGDNGKDWSNYKDVTGIEKLLKANIDGDSIVKTDLDQTFVARWLKIKPTRWNEKIALRIEIYGCDYKPEVLHFDGSAMIKRELSRNPISSLRDSFRFRFKTDRESGIFLYSKGSQGDYIALQLVEAKVLLSIKLGDMSELSMSMGSMLDDNAFHEVAVSREKQDVILSVDGVRVRDKIRGDFQRLNLDGRMFIGGVPVMDQAIVVYENFSGCIENFYVNHSNIFLLLTDPLSYIYEQVGEFSSSCQSITTSFPVTFKTDRAQYKQSCRENQASLNASFEFRTFEESGLLLYHKFQRNAVKMVLSEGRLNVQLQVDGMPSVDLDNSDQTFNDGKWHSVELRLTTNLLVTIIDNEPIETRRAIQVRTGSHVLFGGTVSGDKGFIGCMRKIAVNDRIKPTNDWTLDDFSPVDHFGFNSCQLVDLCTPNPCKHGGICKQTKDDFYCECDGTGYTGAVCHTTLNYMSCSHYHNIHPEVPYGDTMIDIDGSGLLSPFPVRCEVLRDGRVVTQVRHANEDPTKVDGFEEKGSFQQTIFYDATMPMMEELISRSNLCSQKLRYDCKRSRLLNTPVDENDQFSPYGYWISRQNKVMDYWAGSIPGSYKCECGLLGVCFDPDKWCNCDSGHDDWLWDSGEIVDKEYLPVRALHFGDTGTPLDRKEGSYTLGPLECYGDSLFENVVTFRKPDAAIELPTFEMDLSGDIYFEFKTSMSKTMVLIHSTGENGDFFKVSLVDGKKVQFEFESGKGTQGVSVESFSKLDDNQWHSVLIERNRKEARIVLDGTNKAQVKEPTGPIRQLVLTSKLFIGTQTDYKEGFLGCFRSLVLNGNPVDLVTEVTKQSWGAYGLSAGCVGKCSESPCKNGGLCLEGYDHFTCDCQNTTFKGIVCSDEVGVSMRPNYMIEYDFKRGYRTSSNKKIRVAFKTTDPKGFIFGAFSDQGIECMTLRVTMTGHLKLEVDFGPGKQELVFTDQNFKTGHFHDVIIEQVDDGKRLKMIVDNYEPKVLENNLWNHDGVQYRNIRYLYIGRNETMQDGFSGCISRVQFDDLMLLKLLFQDDPLSNVRAIPETMREDFCGVEPFTLPPEELETRKPPTVEEEKIEEYYQVSSSAVLGAGLAIIFIVIVVLSVLFGRYMNRHKGEYMTREDEGAQDAFDADTAVLQGKTGHLVEKKKEWFI